MIRTIIISSTISAQGPLLSTLPDGRLQIEVNGKAVTGHAPSAVSAAVSDAVLAA